MSAVNDMIKDIPLPNMVKIRQEFDSTQIDDVKEKLKRISKRSGGGFGKECP